MQRSEPLNRTPFCLSLEWAVCHLPHQMKPTNLLLGWELHSTTTRMYVHWPSAIRLYWDAAVVFQSLAQLAWLHAHDGTYMLALHGTLRSCNIRRVRILCSYIAHMYRYIYIYIYRYIYTCAHESLLHASYDGMLKVNIFNADIVLWFDCLSYTWFAVRCLLSHSHMRIVLGFGLFTCWQQGIACSHPCDSCLQAPPCLRSGSWPMNTELQHTIHQIFPKPSAHAAVHHFYAVRWAVVSWLSSHLKHFVLACIWVDAECKDAQSTVTNWPEFPAIVMVS